MPFHSVSQVFVQCFSRADVCVPIALLESCLQVKRSEFLLFLAQQLAGLQLFWFCSSFYLMYVEMPRAENGVHTTQRYFCLAIWYFIVRLFVAPQDLSPGLFEWDLKDRPIRFVGTLWIQWICFLPVPLIPTKKGLFVSYDVLRILTWMYWGVFFSFHQLRFVFFKYTSVFPQNILLGRANLLFCSTDDILECSISNEKLSKHRCYSEPCICSRSVLRTLVQCYFDEFI